jgi:hypothetical protein
MEATRGATRRSLPHIHDGQRRGGVIRASVLDSLDVSSHRRSAYVGLDSDPAVQASDLLQLVPVGDDLDSRHGGRRRRR